ncbi:MAG: LysM peptidoglycan-binding domain-containing protein [Puniceicoccales bacterium]|nr:LysM peptidoglycan-binding domain-containing protein [Puniceicoccales bacterium]
MKNFRFHLLFFIFTLGMFLAPVSGQAQSATVVAGLQQDVEAMRQEIRLLRAEVEDLRLAVEKAQAQSSSAVSSSSVKQQMESQNTTVNQMMQAQKAEITADMNRRFAAMESSTNQALASMTKQVNDALARQNASTAPTVRTQPPAQSAPPATPSDMPTTGVRYKVKSGDTVSAIARANKSRVNWILAANNLGPATTIHVGQEIFIPQRDETPVPATSTPAN